MTEDRAALVADIDTMRDVYLSRTQREAYDRITAAALAMQPPGDGDRETSAVLRSLGGHAWTSDCGGYALDSQRAAALIRDHAAQLAAKGRELRQLEDEAYRAWTKASQQEQRADAAEQRIRNAVALIRTDSHAATFQSLGQYRKALIEALAGGAAGVKS